MREAVGTESQRIGQAAVWRSRSSRTATSSWMTPLKVGDALGARMDIGA